MALNSNRIPYNTPTRTPYTHLPLHHAISLTPNPSCTPQRRTFLIVSAAKKFSSRTGKFDSKNKRSSVTTKDEEEELRIAEIGTGVTGINSVDGVVVDDGFAMPDLPGLEADFWEGPQWDALGFFVQYMWAFGVLFALVACGIAVTTYNEGATDFKETPAYKESIQSRELFEGPETSNLDVFESNPTEEAPSLE